MAEKMRYRSILLFGMPGSGKGTQGAVLAQLPGVMHISSGDILRRLPKHGLLSREVMSYTTRGLLVPDELTIRIFERHVEVLRLQEEIMPDQTVLLLDGIPRNYAQAEALAEMLDVLQIFYLRITNMEEAKERLAARALRENRLDDSNEEVILRRFRVYEDETSKTLRFYKPSLIYEINASQTPLRVHRDIVERLCDIEATARVGEIRPIEIPPPPPEYNDASRSPLTGLGDADRKPASVG